MAAAISDICTALDVFLTMMTALIDNNQYTLRSSVLPTCSSTTRFDYIIVGAGSAGCVLANRLSTNPKNRVLLLEAGGLEDPTMDIPGLAMLLPSSLTYAFQAETNPNINNGEPTTVFKGKGLGGSSSINYMMYARGNKADYDHWEELGNKGWGYKDVLPYFLRSENATVPLFLANPDYHSTSGPMAVSVQHDADPMAQALVNAFQTIGIQPGDYNGASQIVASQPQATILDGVRSSTNNAFLRPVLNRPNLVVRTRSRVTRVVLDRTTAKGVQFIDDNGNNQTAYAKKEVILSAGSIQTPQLLMLSGIGPKEHLESLNIAVVKDLPVGQNLMDHVSVHHGIKFNVPLQNFTDASTFLNEHLSSYLNTHQGSFATFFFNSMAFLNTRCFNSSQGGNSTGYSTQSRNREGAKGRESGSIGRSSPNDNNTAENCTVSASIPNVQYVFATNAGKCPTLYFSSVLYDTVTLYTFLVAPKSSGQVLLQNSNPLSDPVLQLNLLTNPDDREVLLEALKISARLEGAESLAKLNITVDNSPAAGCEQYNFGSDDYWDCIITTYSNSNYHQVGTCKMGPQDDGTNVVDPNLRVYGIKNLRVVDAGIMPTIVRGNIDAPTIMIAEKAADLITQSNHFDLCSIFSC